MTATVRNLYRHRASKTETGMDAFRMISLLCGAGLLVSLIGVIYGLDLDVNFF